MSDEPRPFYGGTNAEESGLPHEPEVDRACLYVFGGGALLIASAAGLLFLLL